ncbi:MAG TPA: hypothetical protein VGJ48_03305 [Pyrinomonadaceae bacterium]|jgi:hypothetical protein
MCIVDDFARKAVARKQSLTRELRFNKMERMDIAMSHPGEHLAYELEALNMSAEELGAFRPIEYRHDLCSFLKVNAR